MDHVVAADNVSSQADEIEALSAIYQDDWKVEDAANRVYKIVLCSESTGDKLSFQVTLPPEYPSEAPPFYEISAPWMTQERKARLLAALDDHFYNHLGENILYDWIEIARKALDEDAAECESLAASDDEAPEVVEQFQQLTLESDRSSALDLGDGLNIFHGGTLEDRRSVFQGHLAEVHSVREVEQVLDELKTNKKIAEATHNIWAYRLLQTEPRTVLCKDSEDDGETYAGNRLLHLLDILDVTNVLIVVTRWYGGIHLGPDRFKHINKVARDLLEQHGYIKKVPTPDSKTKGGKHKKTKSKKM
ncbi:protein IMPACT-B-like [Dermacentor andersoni]|uniref:protein IMPACT-B-like n=1 Tax=Dermacentor andersoni TaxID=34620 RepID=UPI0021552F4F|nr:protein IMPACT-B-like [Dermacentor andersoni]